MTTRDAADRRTIQDDRAELEADPHQGSSLASGEGAPLAEDGVLEDNQPVASHVLLGGAPVPITGEDSLTKSSGSGMTAAGDRPIND